MEEIGGFFGLEIANNTHYHQGATKLNTARNCLEYILKTKKYTKIYLPGYSCDVILEPINRLGVKYEFYSIDEHLDPVFDKVVNQGEAFLYINYFGLKQETVDKLARIMGPNLIVDNAQAFFTRPVSYIDTFYSPRKFFGVPDGGYLYTEVILNEDLNQDDSYERMTHLLRRVDASAEEAYEDFQGNEKSLIGQPIKKMSKLTDALLSSVDYRNVMDARRQNYKFFDEHLGSKNLLSLPFDSNFVPMVYPFKTKEVNLRQHLIDNKVFTAIYWPNVLDQLNKSSLEYTLAEQIIPLPIDQRYNVDKLLRVARLIDEH